MKKSANTILFEKQLARIERILKKTDHADLTIQKPARITKSYLSRLEKIKPKNIETAISSGDFNFRDNSFSNLVDQTKASRATATARARATATATATATARAKSKATTKSTAKHLSTAKTKPTDSLSSRYEALKSTTTPTKSRSSKRESDVKVASPSLFGGVSDDEWRGFENWDSIVDEKIDENSSVDQTDEMPKVIRYGDDFVNTETGEIIGSIDDIRYNPIEDEVVNKLEAARLHWENYSRDARDGSPVTELIEKYIKGYGEDAVFANMCHFDKKFWEALDVCHRYETQGTWGNEDGGMEWATPGEYAENVDFILNYMFEKFDPWLNGSNMD